MIKSRNSKIKTRKPTLNDWKDRFLNKIVVGDSYALLQDIPDESVNLVITSPPYFQQRDYDGAEIGNEKKLEDYLRNILKIFRECVRVVDRRGSIVFNLGDKYKDANLMLVPYKFAIGALDENLIKLVNAITWIKLNPTPRQFKRRLVSSTEPFFHFVKSDNYYYDIDSFLRRPKIKKAGNNNNVGKKYFELIERSFLSKREKDLAKKELLEVINEVKRGELDSFRMKIRGIHSMPFGGQEGGRKSQLEKKGFTIIKIYGNGLKRDIIECSVETIKGVKHPAIYPEYIIQEFLNLLTKENDIVLDPFVGSGTTAVACRKMGRDYIGFDINPQYRKYAKERLKNTEFEGTNLELFI